MKKQLTVTSPLLPPLEEFIPYLQKIWDSKWITNNGEMHKELERQLSKYLGVQYISLFTNGTLPLITALQALEIEGEVVTTPYSFVATTHSIWWNKLQPVFVDVDTKTGNLDPKKIESAITDKTTAIMPVHVYGNPCDVEAIQKIADKHNLKVIYDAAHAFGVKINGHSILNYGDLSTLSFHATKTYTTVEGGALICHSAEMKQKIDHLKNFGFAGETSVVAPGINSKMDEIRAAFGLLNLKYIDAAIANRKHIAELYRSGLSSVCGIRFMDDMNGVTHNYSYFPIFVDVEKYGMTRDELYDLLKKHNIYGRRYFYPLISCFEPYKNYTSASIQNLTNASKLADEVICLPIYAELVEEDVNRIIDVIKFRNN